MMASMILTTELLAGNALAGNMLWVRVLVGFDLVFTLLGMALIDTVLVG
jgi:hypothetical protein